MNEENIVDVDVDADRVEQLIEAKEVSVGGTDTPLKALISDIQTAHAELDEYKSGSLTLAQDLSEAAKEAEDEVLQAILSDMSDGAFGVYLRLHRGDLELLGGREGEYSDFFDE